MIICLYINGVEMIDLESGESQGNQDILNEYFVPGQQWPFRFRPGRKKLFLTSREEDDREVYFCNNKRPLPFCCRRKMWWSKSLMEVKFHFFPQALYFKSLIAME